MKLIAIILTALALTGCATAEYAAYADAHKAQAAAQTARYQALADIAKQGDTTAKVAAVMSLQMGGQQQQVSQIAAPKSVGDQLLQWTATLLPGLTNIYGINKQTSLGMRQSDNAAAIGMSTNAAFVGIAGKIQAPGAVTTTTTTTTDNSVRTDSTHTPTVVNQPAPLVVTQPAPITVTQPAPLVVTQPAPLVVPTTTTTSNLTCTTGPC
jgi:hypothetical protein